MPGAGHVDLHAHARAEYERVLALDAPGTSTMNLGTAMLNPGTDGGLGDSPTNDDGLPNTPYENYATYAPATPGETLQVAVGSDVREAELVGLGVDLGDIADYVGHNDHGTAVLLRELGATGFAGRLVEVECRRGGLGRGVFLGGPFARFGRGLRFEVGGGQETGTFGRRLGQWHGCSGWLENKKAAQSPVRLRWVLMGFRHQEHGIDYAHLE